MLTFEDLRLTGYGGFDVVVQRTYNGAKRGWTFGLAGLPLQVLKPAGPPPSTTIGADAHFPVFLTADGGEHRTVYEGQHWNTGIFRTTEFWRYHVDGRRLELPNGIQCFYDADGLLVEVRDRFSNRIELERPSGSTGAMPTVVRQVLGDGGIREVHFALESIGPSTDLPSRPRQKVLSVTYDGRTWTYGYGATHPGKALNLNSVTPPIGPAWSFDQNLAPTEPELTVVLPQGGRIHYQFGPLPGGEEIAPDDYHYPLEDRSTWDGTALTSHWTFGVSGGLVDSIRGVRYIFSHEGPATDSVLSGREVRDLQTDEVLESETRTHQPLPIGPQGEFWSLRRQLLSTTTTTRRGVTFHRQFTYHSADDAGRWSDYGRPWHIYESGNAGTRTWIRTFDYDFSAYIVDRIGSETLHAGGATFTQTWEYQNETGFLERHTQNGVAVEFAAHTGTGAVNWVRDAHGHITTSSHQWGVVKDTNTPMFSITRAINSDGTVASETRRGHTTSFSYDALARVTLSTPPTGLPIQTAYDNVNGRWSAVSRGGYTVTTSLDAFGRSTSIATSDGITTRTAYDGVGRKIYESQPYGGATPEAGRTFTYDGLNRITSIERSGGATIHYAYPSGVDVEITDEKGRHTYQDRAAFGDPSDSLLVGITDAMGKPWSYEYNGLGLLTRVHAPEGAPSRQWNYDADRLITEIHPESGQTTYSYDGNRLATKTTSNGMLAFGYDANDRLVSIDAPGTGHDVLLAYDASDNRTLVQNGFVTSTFEFDAVNRLTKRRDLIGQADLETKYLQYDGWDNLKTVQYPSGNTYSYDYDAGNRVSRVMREPDATLVAEVREYHASGAIARLAYANGREDTFEYDASRHWLTRISGGPLDLTYAYDDVGNVSSIVDVRSERSQSFIYDDLDRLTSVSGWGPSTFTYDALGNRLSRSVPLGPSRTYSYEPGTKRLTHIEAPSFVGEHGDYEYDGVGNLVEDPATTYTYTPFNMVDTATKSNVTTTYRYDADNVRKMRANGTRTELFIHGAGGQTLSEYAQGAADPIARWVRDYVYLGDRLVASVSDPIPPVPAIPTVGFTASDVEVDERAGVLYLPLRLLTPAPLTAPITVHIRTNNGTAVAGNDFYLVTDLAVTFAAGSVNGEEKDDAVVIPLINDGMGEGVQSFEVEIFAATPTDAIGTAKATIRIVEGYGHPPAPVLISPKGITYESIPLFRWRVAAGATMYYFQLTGPNGQVVHDQWFNAVDICRLYCETPLNSPPFLSGGYIWHVKGWNPQGYGPFSAGAGFDRHLMAPPPVLTQLGPSGSVIGWDQSFRWQAHKFATKYELTVSSVTGARVYEYTAAQAGCATGVGNCAVAPLAPFGVGNASWMVRGWNPDTGWGPDSPMLPFIINYLQAPTLSWPSVTGITNWSSLSFWWNAVGGATTYELWVSEYGSTAAEIQQSFTAATALCAAGGLCRTPTLVTLPPGEYTWWIRASNIATGNSNWSAPASFGRKLDGAVLGTPSVTVTGAWYNAEFTWTAVPRATYHYLWVRRLDAGPPEVIQTWLQTSTTGCASGGTCTARIATPLPAGQYRWWIQGWNGVAGEGHWSAARDFNITLTAPALSSPSGTVSTWPNRTFTWTAVPGASTHTLWISKVEISGDVPIWTEVYHTSATGCYNGGTCQVVIPSLVPPGQYKWWVRGHDDGVDGPWSAATHFTINALAMSVLSSPSGTVSGANTTFQWSAVSTATYHYLKLERIGEATPVAENWYTLAQSNCSGGGTCSAVISNLPAGQYRWSIQAWNPSVTYGPWTATVNFTKQ